VAGALRGAWRAAPPAAEISADELAEIAPILLRTASAPLAFWRNRALAGADATLAGLQETWRLAALHAAVLEERLPVAVARLRDASVEPLLAKGWAVARFYPRPGLRPYGDLDLYVRPAERAAARAAVDARPGIAVDLHRGLPELDDRSFDAVLVRAAREIVGRVEVRVLSPEDHLRLLCRHFLRHGASRPVWLCDIALLVEARAPGFDWDLVLAGNRRRRGAVMAAIALAGALLGADLTGTPAAAATLPRWLVPAVLRQWGEGVGHREPLVSYLSRPAAFRAELRRHWPNAVEASAVLEAPFDDRPRFPFQLVHLVSRTARFGLSVFRAAR
jgi:hypothetical protein